MQNRSGVDFAEKERLRILRAYDILDTEFEEQYDDIVALVAAILQVPTALITIIDQDRQWFKSVLGLDVRETDLDVSFCKHMVPSRQPLVVTDATEDVRFRDNAAVTGDPHVRFYAGVPIQAREGVVLGALCGVDYHARNISEEQMRALTILGKQVADQLELRRTTRELKEALDDVMLAQRARERFFATISHDIRTPAIGILGASQLLQKSELANTEERLLHGIETNGKMLLHLLNNLLDLAKMESGGLELEHSVLDLEALALDAVDAQRPQAQAKGLGLKLDSSVGKRLYRGDALRISQILWNLIGNAIKFTHQGEVEVQLSEVENQVVVQVRDTGIGIAKEHLQKIFEPFAQEDATTQRHFGGTGLGLAIVQQLTEVMGGSITLTSEPHRGTTFTVRLPLDHVESGGESIATRVLVVEDNEVNQLVLESMLQDLGVEVQLAANFAAAQKELDRGGYDIVFMDCELPDGSGMDLARAFRDGKPSIKIFGISAHTGPTYHQQCLDAGMDGTLSKPFRLEELRLALSE